MGIGNSSKKQSKVICLGLDNGGKSTILNFLKPEAKKTTVEATVGFSAEKLKHDNINYTFFDMSGQGRYRNLWEHYYSDAQGIVFVIDSSDDIRMCIVKDELDSMLANAEIKSRAPILFYANKMDKPKALKPTDISKLLKLDLITDRRWTIIPSNALKGTGLQEGLKWLSQHMDQK